MSGTHSAPWGRKRRACHGTTQAVIGITVAAGKVWACEPENVLDLGCRGALHQELPGDPQIQDTPVRRSKALRDVPSLHPGLVDLRRLCCRQAWWRGSRRGSRGRPRDEVGWSGPLRRQPCWRPPLGSRLQQPSGAASQRCTGVHDLHPGSVTIGCAPLGLLIGESGQPAQVTPVRTAQVATIGAGQLLAGSRRHGGFQRGVAEVNPGLEMPGLVWSTTQGSCPLARIFSMTAGWAQSRSTRMSPAFRSSA